ncbi:inner membrane protein YhjD [Nocardia stercoris]|uniref:Inner membrane protein YhjD n=1 Tax=Nocardia stercoris TaxID=2483361 RepID=A0A3M2L787_9NOCA|nr:inner membrane protein YhjD [Nocardia stercoris]RMI31765.1 inner membrane protein YhjD [Nocardia stercoris]
MFDGIKSRIERNVEARPWLDHLVRAGGRYQRQRGDYYAAGITYYTVLALFPLAMVGFAAAGFVLSRKPGLLADLHRKILENMPGAFGSQLTDLVNHAIASRASVGVFGLVAAAYAGLGWVANLRAALTEQWEQQSDTGNWFARKFSDLGALVGLGIAMVVSVGLSTVADSSLGEVVLRSIHLDQAPLVPQLLRLLSTALAVLASWALFVWIIARMPHEPLTLASAARAALLAALVFEVWKKVATIYLQIVLKSPAGATFGPIIGLMVFAFYTARIVLFATAWAATATENMTEEPVPVPGPAIIRPRVTTGAPAMTGTVLFGLGAIVGALLGGMRRGSRR